MNSIAEFQSFLAPTKMEDLNNMINGLQFNSDSNQGNALVGREEEAQADVI